MDDEKFPMPLKDFLMDLSYQKTSKLAFEAIHDEDIPYSAFHKISYLHPEMNKFLIMEGTNPFISCYDDNEKKEAMEYLTKALEYYKRSEDDFAIHLINQILVRESFVTQQAEKEEMYQEILKFNFEKKLLFDAVYDSLLYADLVINSGIEEKYCKGLDFLKDAFDFAKEEDYFLGIARVLLSIGSIAMLKKQYDISCEILEESVRMHRISNSSTKWPIDYLSGYCNRKGDITFGLVNDSNIWRVRKLIDKL